MQQASPLLVRPPRRGHVDASVRGGVGISKAVMTVQLPRCHAGGQLATVVIESADCHHTSTWRERERRTLAGAGFATDRRVIDHRSIVITAAAVSLPRLLALEEIMHVVVVCVRAQRARAGVFVASSTITTIGGRLWSVVCPCAGILMVRGSALHGGVDVPLRE